MKKRMVVEVDPDLYIKLRVKLLANGQTVSDWIRKKINEELGVADDLDWLSLEQLGLRK